MTPKTAPYTTKTEYVYAALKDAIVCGDFKPGERLILSKVADKYHLSESPVREAIKRLEAEGLVTSTPHVGAIVSEMAPDEIIENLLIRSALESLATYLAAGNLTKQRIASLRELVNKMEACVKKSDYAHYSKLNRTFHHQIYEAVPYPKLVRMIEHLWDSMERAQAVFRLLPNRLQSSHEEHLAIFEALAAGDAEKAESQAREQKLRLVYLMEEYFKQQEPTRFAPPSLVKASSGQG